VSDRPTRREAVRLGIATAGGALAAGELAARLGPLSEALAAVAPAEARVLTRALEKEQLTVVAYRRVLGLSVVKPAVKDQLRILLGQELTHTALLRRVLAAGGRSLPPPPSIPAAQRTLTRERVHWRLTDLTNQHDCLKLLVDVESLLENVYFDAVGNLADVSLVRLCAEIMGCEAQHWTILSGLLNHRDPERAVPHPFVEGA
jgi:Ferritin-like domain